MGAWRKENDISEKPISSETDYYLVSFNRLPSSYFYFFEKSYIIHIVLLRIKYFVEIPKTYHYNYENRGRGVRVRCSTICCRFRTHNQEWTK